MGKQMKIGEWLDVWFGVYAKPEYAENTVKLYEDARSWLKRNSPDIENRELEELLPVYFQTAMNCLVDRYAKSTIRHIRSLYHMAYDKAIDNGLCQNNPISKTTLPENAPVKKVSAMTKEEQAAFVQAARTMNVKDQFILMTYLLTGLRRGKLRNLRWSDYDRKQKIFFIRRSKTENGIREVPVIPEVALMMAHLWGWKKNKRDLNTYIFGGDEPLNVNHLRYICEKTAQLHNQMMLLSHAGSEARKG